MEFFGQSLLVRAEFHRLHADALSMLCSCRHLCCRRTLSSFSTIVLRTTTTPSFSISRASATACSSCLRIAHLSIQLVHTFCLFRGLVDLDHDRDAEECWSAVKASIRRQMGAANGAAVDQLIVIQTAMNEVTSEMCAGWMQDCGYG